jgi:hypothetical protein
VPKLIQGYVQNPPDFRYAGEKQTPILKFKLQIGDSWFKRQEVVVFGKHAEANQDLEQGEYVMVSGELKENTFFDEPKLELVVGWQGNFKRCKDKPKKVFRPPTGGDEDDEGIVSAPRSYRRGSRDEEDGTGGGLPDLDDCPDYDVPPPTDEDWEEVRATVLAEIQEKCTQYDIHYYDLDLDRE